MPEAPLTTIISTSCSTGQRWCQLLWRAWFWGKAEENHGDLLALTKLEEWAEVLASAGDNLATLKQLIRSLTIQHSMDYAHRIVELVKRDPYRLLWFAKAPADEPYETQKHCNGHVVARSCFAAYHCQKSQGDISSCS